MPAATGTATSSIAGRYAVERVIGEGATAVVYLARDQHVGVPVAVKLLRPELAESAANARFLREIRRTADLKHPHILPVLDVGEHEGRPYFVLPYMDGGTLRQRLQREHQLDFAEAVAIAKRIAEALDYAHGQGLIHRDVKPENILFSNGHACLSDFGIARALETVYGDSLSSSASVVRGTPAYMSPEQAAGTGHYDGRSDIYSLACVFYEMVTGMPAFIGPTPESVIAQRFAHPPRELRVYRPAVPLAMEGVLGKALALQPVERYKTAGDFVSALSATLSEAPTLEVARETRTKRWPLGAGMIAAAVVLLVIAQQSGVWPGATARLDSTAVVLFPVDGDTTLPREQLYALLHEGFSRWTGVRVLDYSVGGGSSIPADRSEAAAIAKRLRAGRYVLTQVSRAGAGISVRSALYDVAGGIPVTQAATVLSANLGEAPTGISRLTSTLLLGDSDEQGGGTRSVPAARLFRAAMHATSAFNLRHADSLFLAALEVDTTYARASLWLAQVRTWQLDPPSRWLSWAERGMSSPAALPPREQQLARALVYIGRGEAARACAIYDAMRLRDPRDFAAWYGLGQCHSLDSVVVRDARSPTGWRFRSSYHRAALAYASALELAPALHRSFEPGAFHRLRYLLFAGGALLRRGVAVAPDTTRFLAYPEWRGDSLLFIPIAAADVRKGVYRPTPEARAAAVENQRALFTRIARAWATALPNSPGTKEALAIGLEMVGDGSSIDTMIAARARVRDPTHALRLASEEFLLRVAFGRSDPAQLRIAAALGDSLLRATVARLPAEARTLGPVAAILGRCRSTATFVRRGRTPVLPADVAVPVPVRLAAESITVYAALGCEVSSEAYAAIRRTVNDAPSVSPEARAMTEYELLGRALSLQEASDAASLARLAQVSDDYMLRAMSAAATGDRGTVRAILDERRRARGVGGTSETSPDAVYSETKLWLTIGDTAAAIAWMDPLLNRPGWLDVLFDAPLDAAAIMRLTVLRAELAIRADDTVTARKWAPFAAVLWSAAEPELRRVARRMAEVGTKS